MFFCHKCSKTRDCSSEVYPKFPKFLNLDVQKLGQKKKKINRILVPNFLNMWNVPKVENCSSSVSENSESWQSETKHTKLTQNCRNSAQNKKTTCIRNWSRTKSFIDYWLIGESQTWNSATLTLFSTQFSFYFSFSFFFLIYPNKGSDSFSTHCFLWNKNNSLSLLFRMINWKNRAACSN